MSNIKNSLPFTPEFCDNMRAMSIREIDGATLKALCDVVIDPTQSQVKRVMDGTGQLNNPYFCHCEGYIVKFNYANEGQSITELLSRTKII
ncbi:MAG: hypothetical protein R3Y07_01940 [Eubacteriales bacterium]